MEKGKAAFDEIRAMAMKGEVPNLTQDEINEEIRLAREDNLIAKPQADFR